MGRRTRLRARHQQSRLLNTAVLTDDTTSTSDSAPAATRANIRARARDQLEAHGRPGKPGQTWYRIENLVQSPGTACIYVYGEIGMWGIEAADFIRDLNQITANQIDLHINSMGGEVFEGIAILNALRAHRATVTTYVDGLAASIASVIAMAGTRIIMGRQTTMMVHEPHIIAIGDAEALRATADMVDQQADNIAATYAEKAGGTVESWRQVMKVETWYSAEEAVAAGLADEVDTTGLPEETGAEVVEEMAASFDLSVFRYAGRDQAPAPVMPSNSAEPAVEPAAEVDDKPTAEPGDVPDPVEEPAPEQEPEPETPAVEPAVVDDPPASEPPAEPADPTPAASATTWWSELVDPTPEPSTVDELFAALWK